MDRDVWTELLAAAVERTPCSTASCRIGYKLYQQHVDLEHLDPSQDHPYGAHLTISMDTFQNTRRTDLAARLVRWMHQVHPAPTVRLLA